MIKNLNLLLIFYILCFNLKHVNAQTPQNNVMPPMPVQPSSINTVSSTSFLNTPSTNAPPISNSIPEQSNNTSGKYFEYQSICRSEIPTVQGESEKFSVEKEKQLTSEYKKTNTITNFQNIFNYYLDYEKINEAKNFLNIEKKTLTNSQYVFFIASILIKESRYYEAISTINNELKDFPADQPLLDLISKCYKKIGNLYEAKAALQDLIKLDKKNHSKYLLELCILETLDSNHGDAEIICNKVTKIQPDNEIPLIYLGISSRERLNYDQAINYFKLANKIKQTEFGTTCLAEVFALQKNFKEAAEIFKSSTQLESKSGRAFAGVANSYFKLKQYDEALPYYVEACRLDKKTSALMKESYKELNQIKNKLAEKYFSEIQKCNQNKK